MSAAPTGLVQRMLTDPAYQDSRRAVLPFVALVAGAAWLGGWGWWSLLAPLGILALLVAVGGLAWLVQKAFSGRTAFDRLVRLDRPDGVPAAPAPSRKALAAAPETRLHLRAWRITVPLIIDIDQEEGPDGVWPETARAVAAVHAWGPAERDEVRRLLLDDARAALAEVGEPCPHTPETIEAEVRVQDLLFRQVSPARAGVGLLNLFPSWEVEHGCAIVIRDGRPAGVINGLKQDPSDVWLEDL